MVILQRFQFHDRFLKVITMNCLAHDRTQGFYFTEAHEETIQSWEHRQHLLKNHLQDFIRQEVDVFLLQEITPLMLAFLRDEVFAQFEVLHEVKASSPDNIFAPLGLAVFYRQDIRLRSHERLEFAAGNQLAIFARFERNSYQFNIYCTHLKAKEEFAALRGKQMQELLQHYQKKSLEIPTIIAGDFNTHDSEEIVHQQLRDYGFESIAGSYTTKKSRQDRLAPESAPIIKRGREDWIYYYDCVAIGRLSTPPETEFPPSGYFCSYHPSDHIAIGAAFYLTVVNKPPLENEETIEWID